MGDGVDNVHLTGDFLLKFATIGGMTFLIILIHLFSYNKS
eukprot:COSAG03_NODE_2261_length_2946_cov_32.904812_6_plen_39_part_01